MWNFLIGLPFAAIFGSSLSVGYKIILFVKYNIWYILLLILTLILSCLYINQKYELDVKANEIIRLKNLLWEDYGKTLRD